MAARIIRLKATLTVDAQLIPLAKQQARRQGTSPSSMVEAALREAARGDDCSFVERWRGRFRPAGRNSARYHALARKYP